MVAMRMMQPVINKIVHMISVRDGLMPATRSVDVFGRITFCALRAAVGVRVIYFDHMFVNMVSMHMMEMSIMQIIHVPLMVDGNMPAIRPMLVRVIRVFGAIVHISVFL